MPIEHGLITPASTNRVHERGLWNTPHLWPDDQRAPSLPSILWELHSKKVGIVHDKTPMARLADET
jgi:hypothetical protein